MYFSTSVSLWSFYCLSLLRLRRKFGSNSEFIKVWAEISPSYIQGVPIVTAFQERPTSQLLNTQERARPNQEAWYLDASHVGNLDTSVNTAHIIDGIIQPKHLNLTQYINQRMPPAPCPNCQKGFLWKWDCKSHFLKDGTVLTDANDPTATDKHLVNWGYFQMGRSSPTK